ncbi:unnamed protein product [Microthlaspi erraticum]|uniref:Retrotransposon gag domain-containing protein n=1 Tax=Microthlaspi erraticum TaxID=1685480 RepID=A0A6D2I1U3_9BRAS|nr:unnamed protein product [Microthlaspi erraticum]
MNLNTEANGINASGDRTIGASDPELEFSRKRQKIAHLESRVQHMTRPALDIEIEKFVADTSKHPFTPRIADVRLRARVEMNLHEFAGYGNPKQWLILFHELMRREQFDSLEEKDAHYCQAFVQHLSKGALKWYYNLPVGSINSYNELLVAFVKHYSIFMV